MSCTSRVVVPLARRPVLVRAAAAASPVKKADQAAKRTRQNERRRVYNKAKKSEIHTRMKKVCLRMSLYKSGSRTCLSLEFSYIALLCLFCDCFLR